MNAGFRDFAFLPERALFGKGQQVMPFVFSQLEPAAQLIQNGDLYSPLCLIFEIAKGGGIRDR